MSVALSLLDLTTIRGGESAADTVAASVRLARQAESAGYRRVWYAEHHNNAAIASSSPATLIAHVAAHTTSIRLGAGGIMLPNHSPLVVAEQFALLETLHPGRIDLGLGRAPGTDRAAMGAMRRDAGAADRFPDDVLELQGYLAGASLVPEVQAMPVIPAPVPLYILGSSLFGARLAAALGLPYAFASQFAPDALHEAVAAYRGTFRPSAQLAEPYVIAGVNVIASETAADAEAQALASRRLRAAAMFARGRQLTDDEADTILALPAGNHVAHMQTYAAIGTPDDVREYLEAFAKNADADELMTVHLSPSSEDRQRSVALLAEAMPQQSAH